jgi:RNA polymerase sigma-70 factor (ECF subfamily)
MSDSDAGGSPDPRDDIEQAVRQHVTAGEIDLAATRALEGYGPELYGFLRALARNDDLAGEAFSTMSEQLWHGLAKFRWEATIRTWAYQLARHALHHARTDPRRRPERNMPMSLVTSIEEVRRSATAPYQRTEVKDRMRALRESLDPVDHEILILRLDRLMSWKDIARAMSADGDSPATIDQSAAALRKRFERAKVQLRKLAVSSGLLPDVD